LRTTLRNGWQDSGRSLRLNRDAAFRKSAECTSGPGNIARTRANSGFGEIAAATQRKASLVFATRRE